MRTLADAPQRPEVNARYGNISRSAWLFAKSIALIGCIVLILTPRPCVNAHTPIYYYFYSAQTLEILLCNRAICILELFKEFVPPEMCVLYFTFFL